MDLPEGSYYKNCLFCVTTMSAVDHEQVSEQLVDEIFKDLREPKWKDIEKEVKAVMKRLGESLKEGRLPNFTPRKPTWALAEGE